MLLVQLEVPRAVVCTAVRRAAGRGARVVINTAPYATLPHDVVALGDPVVANEREMQALAEAGVQPLSLLVTFGGNSTTWDGVTAPAVEVAAADVLDTTAAGDAFCGALAAALASGAEREVAMSRPSRRVPRPSAIRAPSPSPSSDPSLNVPARCEDLHPRTTTAPVRR